MGKKTNTFLFILAATIFNIVATIVCFFVLLLVFLKFFAHLLPETASAWALPAIFIGSIVLSFVFYRLALKLLLKKIDLDKHFSPLFKPRR
ncbi:MAG: leader peptide processing enzyme [Treponema sp.]|nr:leader peptide processing enzyme [Treponema sp.]